jgi:hypothetical protein
LATHSPSTVALAPEESLFFVKDGQAQKIGRTTAIEGLTQGYSTTEGATLIFRTIQNNDKNIILFSEGKNSDYLGPVINKLGYEDQIHVHSWDQSGSKGTDQLKTLMRLFIEMLTTTIKNKKIVFLFDCDVDRSSLVKSTDIVKGIVLPKNLEASHPAQRGIENIIPKQVLESLGKEIYKRSNNENSIRTQYKEKVFQHFIAALDKEEIDQISLKDTFKELFNLCEIENAQLEKPDAT